MVRIHSLFKILHIKYSPITPKSFNRLISYKNNIHKNVIEETYIKLEIQKLKKEINSLTYQLKNLEIDQIELLISKLS